MSVLLWKHRYLHEDANLVHRDLKPSNILLTSKGVAKLCDFGISTSTDSSERRQQLGVGTLQYMAPELLAAGATQQGMSADGLSEVVVGLPTNDGASQDALMKTDIFALGCIFWEMGSTMALWEGEDDGSVRARVLSGDRPDIESVALAGLKQETVQFRSLILKCWSQQPADRPNARTVATTLRCL